jgi:hypothetical protein
MVNLKSLDVVYKRMEKDGITKTLLMSGQGTEGGQRDNVKNFGLRILHHNVQRK